MPFNRSGDDSSKHDCRASERKAKSIYGAGGKMSSEKHITKRKKVPFLSFVLLGILIMGCVFAPFFCKDASYMDLMNCSRAPGRDFFFGTDTMGRDLFSCIWHGGRVSLTIGFLSAAISAAIAVLYGTASALSPAWLDRLLMRLVDVLLSVPSLLLVLFVQAVFGKNIIGMSAAIGLCGWFSMAKIVRTQAKTVKESGFVTASQCMGGGFFHVLYWHLAPNFLPSILFMIIMSVRTAIAEESTLSFLGLGLPIETISWGSMLALAQNAFVMRAWWMILIPGLFLILLFLCLTEIGSWCQERMNHKKRQM